jgi:hypothetical protein
MTPVEICDEKENQHLKSFLKQANQNSLFSWIGITGKLG